MKYLKHPVLKTGYKFKLTHIPSALSMYPYVKFIYALLKSNFKTFSIVLGKLFGKAAYLATDKNFFDYVIFQDESLFNSFGVALGSSYNSINPVWLNISDSQILNGLFYEFALHFTEHHNLFVTIDFDNLRLKGNISDLININTLKILFKIPVYIMSYNDLDESFKLEIPSIIIFKTKKGYGIPLLEQNPQKYHSRVCDETFIKEICR